MGDAWIAGNLPPLEETPPKRPLSVEASHRGDHPNHNYRTELVGFNQINTKFDSEYVRIQNLEGYDRIAQYYFRPGEYNSDDDGNSDGSDKDI